MKDINENVTVMLAAVVSIEPVLVVLQEARVRDRKVFVVDHAGPIVAQPDTKNFVPGTDLSGTSELVKQIRAMPQELRSTQTIRFTQRVENRSVEMIGTFSTLPEINWAIVAQRSLDQARADAGVTELNRQPLAFVSVVGLAAVLVGSFFPLGISGPIP